MYRLIVFYFLLIFLFSCKGNPNPNSKGEEKQTIEALKASENVLRKFKDLSLDYPSLVDIQKLDTSIHIELKYATSDNFMGIILYDSIRSVYLQKDVALKLSKAQQLLKKLHPSYRLLVYDGTRPFSVQKKMWNALDSIPPNERGKFVSNPRNGGSIHNYGAAVDLTIIDENNKPLDMGAKYDEIKQIAYPSKESYYLSIGELTQQQISNRQLLRKVMAEAGFRNIPTEWWHFNSCQRAEAMKKYTLIK